MYFYAPALCFCLFFAIADSGATPQGSNSNNVNINVVPAMSSDRQLDGALPQPLRLDVDNGIEWGNILIGAGTIISSLGMAVATWRSQRELVLSNEKSNARLIKSNVANFRHKWQETLRNSAANFIALVAEIKLEQENDPKYLLIRNNSSNGKYSQLITAQATISMLLDPNKDDSAEIDFLMQKVVAALKSNPADVEVHLNSLLNKFTQMLEAAWGDIKGDLGN